MVSCVVLFGLTPTAFAIAREEAPVPTLYQEGAPTLTSQDQKENDRESKDESSVNKESERDNATLAKEAEENDGSTSTDVAEKEQTNSGRGEQHRSEVARFVEKLLEVADRDGGIGEQVRVIASEQASSSEKVAEAADQIEKRGKVKTFFFGSDYKNLGAIRSEIVQTESRIGKLDGELARAASSTDVTGVQTELAAMRVEQARLDEYVKTNESKFSLFGWVIRFFQ